MLTRYNTDDAVAIIMAAVSNKTGWIGHDIDDPDNDEENVNETGSIIMKDKDKILEYEIQIRDMLNTLRERYDELADCNELSDFEAGRKLAYFEIMDIIRTRHTFIVELIEDE